MVGKVASFNTRALLVPGPDPQLATTPRAGHSSLAYHPALLSQIDNLRHLLDWDGDTTALVKMVAGQLHSRQQVLSARCDNDQFLAELETMKGPCTERDTPEYLRQFFRQVADEVECNPECFHSLLSSESVARVVAPPLAQDGDSAAARMLSSLAWNALNKVVGRLVIEALPIHELKMFRDNYEDLRSIYLGNYTPQRKLEELSGALQRLGDNLATCANNGQQYELVKGALDTLKSYLEAVTPWMTSVSRQWMTLEHGIQAFQNNESVLGQVVGLLAMTETVLSDSKLRAILGEERLGSIDQGLGAMRQTLGQVQLWQALPGDTGLAGYLEILAGNSLVQKVLDESTLSLAKVLAHVKDGYPADASLETRMAWLGSVLSNAQLRAHLQPHVEMVLGGKAQADQLFATFEFVGQLQFFPVDSSLGGQALWLMTLLSQSSGETPALEWIKHFQSALGADPATLVLLNRLLVMNQHSESWSELMRDLAKQVAPTVGLLGARHAANHLLPLAMVQQLEKFYQESSATESWADMCQRMAASMLAMAKPYVVGALMGDPLSAVTVQYAEAIQKHTSFDETLRWFVANDPSQDKTLQFAYTQYLNAMLVWQVYQAFNSHSPEETEATLRQLAARLKDYQVVKSYPQLEKLIDLIPLLPALREARHSISVQPAAETWLGWCNQWLDTVAHSNSKSLLELRDRLSRTVENWLADAAMSACDSVAQQSWEVLPGAAAASTSGVADDARPTDATTSIRSVAAPSGRANWQLGVGISLEAIGLAAIGYGIWQWRRAGQVEPAQEIELREVLVGSTLVKATDETSPFQAPEGNVAAIAPRVSKASLMDQKLPLLLGVAAMGAGGAFLYRWATSGIEGASSLGNPQLQQELKILSELQVPDLSFLFYEEMTDNEASSQVASSPMTANAQAVVEGERGRGKRDVQINSEDIPNHISECRVNTDTHNESLITAVFAMAERAEEVVRLSGRPAAEINVVKLLKSIEVLDGFIGRLSSSSPSARSYQRLLNGLWQIANDLTDQYGQSKVRQYKVAFLIGSASPLLGTEPLEAVTRPLSNQQLAIMESSAGDALQQLDTLKSPILDPSGFIDDYIKTGIQRYEQQSGTTTNLLPNSYVQVTYHPGPYDPTMVPPNVRAPSTTTVRVPLRDVVTGHYLYDFKQARDTLGRSYSFPRMTFEPSGVINALTRENLQTVMERALSAYRGNSANRSGLTAYYQSMIKLRCLAYLDSPNRIPAYQQAVEAFLSGSVRAEEVAFNGTQLNGVFRIPTGYAGGVLFSVDDSRFFHVRSEEFTYRGFGESVTESISVFPDTPEFKSWILAKLPSIKAREYKNKPVSIFSTQVTSDLMAMPPSVYLRRPFSFTSSQNQGDLANKLFDGLMTRLNLDIDHLVFSSFEQITGHLLEVAKTILTVTAIALNTAAPGTGTLLNRVGLFIASLAVDGAYVAATLTQAHMADRPEDAAAFRNEAMIAGMLGGLAVVSSGAPLTRQGIRDSLALYRRAKLAMPNLVPMALRRVTWTKLADAVKVDVLVNSMKVSEPARNLARLTNPDVVATSIRQNLVLDSLGTPRTRFTWGDLAFEQAQVERRLQSDFARLNLKNEWMNGLLDSPPTLQRNAMAGDAEQAAVNWITGNSRSATGSSPTNALQRRIGEALSQNRQADLLDIATVDRVHDVVYQPAQGQVERVFRSSSDPLFMGSDVAREGFKKMLDRMKLKVQTGQTDTTGALFGAVVGYHPYGDGNGRTARTMYALAQLKKNEATFKALNPLDEDLLSGLPSMRP